jgi:23S rRNA pseudouridine2457 synthase
MRSARVSDRESVTIAFNKPYGVLSQFTKESGHDSLASFGPFPKDVYPVGRLDWDSEGLLLLTNDNDLKHRLTTPKFGHSKTYLVQVERLVDVEAVQKLEHGVVIGGKATLPAAVRVVEPPTNLPERPVPIRFRKNVPTSWLEITISEGRNHQVRKMTAAVGHPTLRLLRIRIGALDLEGLASGEHKALGPKEVQSLLAIPATPDGT